MLALLFSLVLSAASVGADDAPKLEPTPGALLGDDAWEVDRELRIVEGRIQLTKPQMPYGYVVGMILGFTLSVLLLPGVPLLIVGVNTAAALFFIGLATTLLGGAGLAVGVLLAVLGNNAEEQLAFERARLVERREALQRRLDELRPPPTQAVPPAFPPGVWREAPRPAVVLARF